MLLVLSGPGCRSVYRFRCTSRPSGAGVLVGQKVMGETACSIKIPKKSGLIQDGKIEFTFCLPDGRQMKRVIDLHPLKPTNPVAELVAMPFLLAGAGLLVLAGGDKDHEDTFPGDDSQGKNTGGKALTVIFGLGVLALGGGVYALLGGSSGSLSDYPVRADFDEPQDDQERGNSQADSPRDSSGFR